MKTLRLFNAGQADIGYGEGHSFRKGTSIDFPIEIANKLKKLYPDTLRGPNDNVEGFAGKKEDKPANLTVDDRLNNLEKSFKSLAALAEKIDNALATFTALKETIEKDADRSEQKGAPEAATRASTGKSKAKKEVIAQEAVNESDDSGLDAVDEDNII